MLAAAADYEIDILTFWELTPKEFGLVVKAKTKRMQVDQEERITIAYMTALWTVQWQSKRKPKSLDSILGRDKKRTRMTDEEMFTTVRKLHKLFGGE